MIVKKVGVSWFKTGGRGVQALTNFRKGEQVMTAEVIEFPVKENKLVHKTVLDRYVYELNNRKIGLALEYGSLLNHSDDNNLDSEVVKVGTGIFERYIIEYTATRDINFGEQLTIDYGYDPITLKKKRKK